jgi:uncharacterized protein (DUF1330 family)
MPKQLLVIAAFLISLGFGLVMTLASNDSDRKGYIIGIINVTDQAKYGEYMKVSPAVIEKMGGHFVARAGNTKVLEGLPVTGRVVIVEFPSFERAEQFYNSPEYQSIKKLRDGAANVQFILIEGS